MSSMSESTEFKLLNNNLVKKCANTKLRYKIQQLKFNMLWPI